MPMHGNVLLRAQFTDLITERLPYIDEILFEKYDAPTLSYTSVFNVRDSSRAYEQITEITGLGTFSPKTEGDVVDYDKVMQGFDKKFTHTTFAKAVAISMEAAADDLDGAISNMMPPLGRSCRSSVEIQTWNLLNLGFTATTGTLTPDGKPLFASDHFTVAGLTSLSNLVTGDLSIATLETAINIFDNMVDDRGLPIELSPTSIVFPTNMRWLVYEILKSDLRSDTGNNATNAFKQIAINPIMSKYLTDADSWFILSDPSMHQMIVYWRMEPVTDHTIDFDTGNMKTKMTYRISTGAAGWRGTVGGLGV